MSTYAEDIRRNTHGGIYPDGEKNPHGALPLFIGGGDHSAVRGCENSEGLVVSG